MLAKCSKAALRSMHARLILWDLESSIVVSMVQKYEEREGVREARRMAGEKKLRV